MPRPSSRPDAGRVHPVLLPVGWAEAAEAFIPSGFIPSGGPMPRPPSRSRGAEAAEVFTMCFTGGPRRPVGTHAGLHPDLGGPVRHMWQHIPPRQAQRGSRSPGSGWAPLPGCAGPRRQRPAEMLAPAVGGLRAVHTDGEAGRETASASVSGLSRSRWLASHGPGLGTTTRLRLHSLCKVRPCSGGTFVRQ